MEFALWLIDAEESCDSSGGAVQFYAVTDGETTLPDVLAAFDAVGSSNCSLYRVNSVRLVEEFDRRAMYSDWVHDQRKPRAVPPGSLGL